MSASDSDSLYRIDRGTGSFRFDAEVVEVFLDMIGRSVPCYWEVSRIGAIMAAQCLTPGDRVYDLGASLLTSTLEIAARTSFEDVEFLALDASESMVEVARQRANDARVRVECVDVFDVRLLPAKVVVLNWTLQFLPPARREELLREIRRVLQPGGLLLLSEKLDTGGPGEYLHDAHLRFKVDQGYSEAEVANKLRALGGVMQPDTLETHQARLAAAGFDNVDLWFRCLNWVSFVARV